MNDPSRELFENYQQYYASKRLPDSPLAQVRALRLDRLPRWLGRIDHRARILDAGCADGYLLSLFRDSGYSDLTGVELSSQMADAARRRLPPDVRIEVDDIRHYLARTEPASFDVILFHHVLEHISREHTVALLREFGRCLRGGGLLSVKVPNALSLAAGYACYGDFTHVVHFNEKSLGQVLEAAGFDTNRIEFVRHPPMLFWSGRHPARAVLRLLNRLRWHLNQWLHRAIYVLSDVHPAPRVFEAEIEALAVKADTTPHDGS